MVIKRIGFGQVEPNHMAFQQTGQIYAQGHAVAKIEQLENGQFVKYDLAKGETDKLGLGHRVNFDGIGEWMMVFNEEKFYGDHYLEGHKDYAMLKKNFTDGEMVPRVVKTNIGDIYTTNCVGGAGAYRQEYEGIDLKVGDEVSPNAEGFLVPDGDGTIVFTVIKVYTMPDGQPAVKLQRTK